MNYLFLLAFLLVYIFFGNEIGYTATSPWWTHITYIFQHGNLLHLAVNSMSFYFIYVALRRRIPPASFIIPAFIIGVVASFFTPYPFWQPIPNVWDGKPMPPVVGASGMIFAMIGIYFILLARKIAPQTRNTPIRNTMSRHAPTFIFMAYILLFLALSMFRQNIAGTLHLICFLSGASEQIISGQATSKLIKLRDKQPPS